uniref:Grass carp reovirus (GCRV)-induced gene 2p n=1 Tax=Erpetoichthys calabaricus TaxID=27687 RepID=A0A8C4XC58_ERPCA
MSNSTSVDFYGWEVSYDDDHHLTAEQEPTAGRIYTMYHGASVNNARSIIRNGFNQSRDGMLGPGVYISRDQKKADRYPINNPPTDRVSLKLKVDVGKVKKIDTDNNAMQKTWHSNGYDTAWVPPNCGMKAVPSGLEEDCVWDPKRIEVIDIARAPSDAIKNELQALITQTRSLKNTTSQQNNQSGTTLWVAKCNFLNTLPLDCKMEHSEAGNLKSHIEYK